MPGEQSGNSIADILYGRVNPGGKLPFTMGRRRQDYGTDLLYKPNGKIPQDNFQEGVFIDYRAFDKKNTTPVYEFGYGLSYTTFTYSNLQIRAHNVGPYTPTMGMTAKAPVLGKKGSAKEFVFPKDTRRVPLYIYPYLNSTNLKASSGDRNYGADESSVSALRSQSDFDQLTPLSLFPNTPNQVQRNRCSQQAAHPVETLSFTMCSTQSHAASQTRERSLAMKLCNSTSI